MSIAILAKFDRINATIATRQECEKQNKAERGGSLIVLEYGVSEATMKNSDDIVRSS